MFALVNQPSPAGKGDRRTPVDEEIAFFTAQNTERKSYTNIYEKLNFKEI